MRPGGNDQQERVDRSRLPVEHQPERVVCDQPGGIGPVAGREHVPHGLDDLPVVGEPPRGPAVEVGNLIGQRSAELQAQEIRQQLVVAKPGALASSDTTNALASSSSSSICSEPERPASRSASSPFTRSTSEVRSSML